MANRKLASEMLKVVSTEFNIEMSSLRIILDKFFPELTKASVKIKQQGAGNQTDHYFQDLSEVYFCYKYQSTLEEMCFNLTPNRSKELYKEYTDYVDIRDIILSDYDASYYKINIDTHIKNIVIDNLQFYDNKHHDIYDVEKESRNKGCKADFILQFKDFSEKYSLKNYKKLGNIQVCSGTYVSLLDYFVLNKSGGPGSFIDSNGVVFSNRNKQAVFEEYTKCKNGTELYILREELIDLNMYLKNKYVYGTFAEHFTEDVEKEFDKDKLMLANEAMDLIITALKLLNTQIVKDKILSRTGLCNGNDSQLLCIFPSKFYNSATNKNFKELLISLDTSCVVYNKHKQSLKFSLKTLDQKVLLDINIPFTINKNGAWFHDSNYKTEPFYYKSEQMYLYHNQRRPKKSAELAPSTNMYVSISQLFD